MAGCSWLAGRVRCRQRLIRQPCPRYALLSLQAPGGHNIISGLYDYVKSTGGTMYGFLDGPRGLFTGESPATVKSPPPSKLPAISRWPREYNGSCTTAACMCDGEPRTL